MEYPEIDVIDETTWGKPENPSKNPWSTNKKLLTYDGESRDVHAYSAYFFTISLEMVTSNYIYMQAEITRVKCVKMTRAMIRFQNFNGVKMLTPMTFPWFLNF